MTLIEDIPTTVTAAAVLHNVILPNEALYEEIEIEVNDDPVGQQAVDGEAGTTNRGAMKRLDIAHKLV